MRKSVDEYEKLRYNAILQGYILKGGFHYVENISAKKAPQKKGARLQKENVHIKRTEGFIQKKS